MKILLLGDKGQLGKCLKDKLDKEKIYLITTSKEILDIVDFKKVEHFIKKISPDVIINASAYTYVDQAEIDYDYANLVNNIAVKNLASICRDNNIWLVHFSTDYVFEGNGSCPYKEDHETNPVGAYGKTKLHGEESIISSKCKYFIIRTSWVFSEYGKNFFKTMISLGTKKDIIEVVDDQIGCPTYAQDLASASVKITLSINESTKGGIYNFCGNIPCSWFDFAKEIFQKASKYDFDIPKKILPVDSTKFKSLAPRPSYSVLDNTKIFEDFGITGSDWSLAIDKILKLNSFEH